MVRIKEMQVEPLYLPPPLSCIPPAPTFTCCGPGLGNPWQTHPPSLAQMSNGLKTEGKAVLRPR